MKPLALAAMLSACAAPAHWNPTTNGRRGPDDYTPQQKATAQVLADIDKRKRDDAAARDKRAQIDAAAAAERERRSGLLAEAAKAGHRGVVFDQSVTDVLEAIVAGDLTVEEMKDTVLEVDAVEDYHFVALQALGEGSAIFAGRYDLPVIMLRKYGTTVVEGSALPTMRNRCVVLVGLTTYRTIVGTRQAFVIEPAW